LIPTLLRLIRVGWTLARYDVLFPKELTGRLPPAGRIVGQIARIGGPKTDGDIGARMSVALEELGPAWIKFGQFLATRPDIIGAEAALGLSRLKDRLAPFSQEEARKVLAETFIGDADTLFPQLGPPIAAASIAQVHKITDPDGRQWAVKLLRPNIEKLIARELKGMMLVARTVEFWSKASRRLKPVAFVQTVGDALTKELDLRREAGAGDAFGEIVAFDPYLACPRIDWTRSGQRALTTSWVDGKSLTDPTALDGHDRVEIARKVTRGFLAAALDHGVFHADMHEGNLILAEDGTLFAIDFGIMGRLGPPEQRFLAEILFAFLRRDYRRAAAVHFEAGYVPASQDVGEFAHSLRAIGEPIWGRPASEVSMGRLLLQLLDTTEHFGMAMRPELVLLQKTMVQVEGVARGIDPDHDIWETSRVVVERFMRRELGPEGQIKRALGDMEAGLAALRKLPALVERLEAEASKKS
jgi:ubiquinone biosynthesis protein